MRHTLVFESLVNVAAPADTGSVTFTPPPSWLEATFQLHATGGTVSWAVDGRATPDDDPDTSTPAWVELASSTAVQDDAKTLSAPFYQFRVRWSGATGATRLMLMVCVRRSIGG